MQENKAAVRPVLEHSCFSRLKLTGLLLNKNRDVYTNLKNFWYERYPEEGESSGYNVKTKYKNKEFPDVHHSPLNDKKDRMKWHQVTNVVSNTLTYVWIGLFVMSLYFIVSPYFKNSVKGKTSHPIIKRSTPRKDTTIYTDTLSAPK